MLCIWPEVLRGWLRFLCLFDLLTRMEGNSRHNSAATASKRGTAAPAAMCWLFGTVVSQRCAHAAASVRCDDVGRTAAAAHGSPLAHVHCSYIYVCVHSEPGYLSCTVAHVGTGEPDVPAVWAALINTRACYVQWSGVSQCGECCDAWQRTRQQWTTKR